MTSCNYILGINRGHNGSVCLLKDGALEVAIEVERLERIKYANGNYVQHAIDYCLREAGISEADVGLTVTNSSYCSYPESDRNLFVSHHLAHAYSVFALSDFKDAAIIIADGSGNCFADVLPKERMGLSRPPEEEEAESYYYAKDGRIEPVLKRFCAWKGKPGMTPFEVKSSHRFPSLGHMYSLATDYIFGGWTFAGKTMALAAYGKETFSWPIVHLGDDGQLDVDVSFIDKFGTPWNLRDGFQECADLAYKVQKEYEDALVHQANWLYRQTKAKNLCVSGGCALNIVANHRLLSETPFERVFVMFAPGDNGIAIGAAHYGLMKTGGTKKGPSTPFLGRAYTSQDIVEILKKRRDISFEVLDDPCATAAELISQGNVVGWFQGRSEFGPRALGNRSILADPRKPGIVAYLNEKVKHREWFRPYSPSVQLEHAEEFFRLGTASPYMSFVGALREECSDGVPGAAHTDGTARVHTVTEDLNPLFYQVLGEFRTRTGIPLVINTSFNDRGPISETPADALKCYLGTNIDYLIMGDYLVKKDG